MVLAVNGQPLRTTAELRAVVVGPGQSVALLIRRGPVQLYVPVETS